VSPIDEQTVQATERPRLVPHEPDVSPVQGTNLRASDYQMRLPDNADHAWTSLVAARMLPVGADWYWTLAAVPGK
jgi:hypothetical protein